MTFNEGVTGIETHYFTHFYPPDELILESGERLGPITIAYETYGTLNAQKTNAVWVCHALSGDAHAAFTQKDNLHYIGWWDYYIGPGKAIDTNHYFVICSNALGGCKGSTGPSSINPKTQTPFGLSFPVITIGDMVKTQKSLLDVFGIEKLRLVVGGSMGGMQALEWAIQFPDKVSACVPIASTAHLSPQALAFDAVGRHAIISDPDWKEGHYYDRDQPESGLAIARMIGHITYLSSDSLDIKFGRKLQKKTDYGYGFDTDFQIESYLKYQGNKFVSRFDANTYLYLTKAMGYFDLHKKYGTLEKAFSSAQSKFLIIGISSDWLYPPRQSKEMAWALMRLNKEVTYTELHSPYGHDAFLLDNPHLSALLSHFLKESRL